MNNKTKTKSIRNHSISNCMLCDAPYNRHQDKNGRFVDRRICPSCRKKLSALNYRRKYKINEYQLAILKRNYDCADVFQAIKKDPYLATIAMRYLIRPKRHQTKKKNKSNSTTANTNTKVSGYYFPPYLNDLFGEDATVIKLSGDIKDPKITYKCNKCGEIFTDYYFKIRYGKKHQCTVGVSSGEVKIREFLHSKNIPFKVQYDTLKCVNPDTNRIMPYDFELSGRKIIIEVQGDQHKEYVQMFHHTEDDFEQQKKRDLYKKHYAESKGYKFIEIWYDDFKDDMYQKKIIDAIIETKEFNRLKKSNANIQERSN